ncbi:methyl-accepting chemotaxis protein [Roseospira navarrensis]|uniref:Methyl-accepting transducer domain-containing protein n=1 Tax=Roseospira navarrensis TaxID=140058 RepID=A0A7X1ZCB7_9PROT|nr:methyl-accepting chemotaxis protein [Roseospira navarrensis]MQX35703.1 hypothetical protein [Roseospira navarrensis]
MVKTSLDQVRIDEFKKYINLTQSDLSLVMEFRDLLRPHLPNILDDFYVEMETFPPLHGFVPKHDMLERVKEVEINHWMELFSHPLDASFVEKAQAVGRAHARIGLDERWYMAAYAKVLDRFFRVVGQHRKGRKAIDMIAAIQKVVMIDMELALSVYGRDVQDMALDEYGLGESIDNIRHVAKLAEMVNDAMIQLAELVRESRDINGASQTIASAAEELTTSTAQIAESGEDTAADAREVESAVRAGQSSAETAVDGMRRIAAVVADTAQRVEGLREASEQIGEILVSIEAIAKQTNLLALNATIEAARAGEAGKGFAVVAGEVKTLATQTAKATEDIRGRIDTLRTEMNAIVTAMEESRQAVDSGSEAITRTGADMRAAAGRVGDVTRRADDMSGILGQQTEATREISDRITRIADKTRTSTDLVDGVARTIGGANSLVAERVEHWMRDESALYMLETAKVDHILFRKGIIDAVMGAVHKDAASVPDHHTCRFGKWYDQQTDPALTAHPGWKAIQEPHKRVHACARAALEAHNTGDTERAFALLRELHDGSREIITALETLAPALEQDIKTRIPHLT